MTSQRAIGWGLATLMAAGILLLSIVLAFSAFPVVSDSCGGASVSSCEQHAPVIPRLIVVAVGVVVSLALMIQPFRFSDNDHRSDPTDQSP